MRTYLPGTGTAFRLGAACGAISIGPRKVGIFFGSTMGATEGATAGATEGTVGALTGSPDGGIRIIFGSGTAFGVVVTVVVVVVVVL